MKYFIIYLAAMATALLLIVFTFSVSYSAEGEKQVPELFPGIYLVETQWHPDDRSLVYFLFDENVSVLGWTDAVKVMYLTDLASGLTPAVYMNGQQVERLLADIKIVFMVLDKDGMQIGHLSFTKEQYLKWFWFNTL